MRVLGLRAQGQRVGVLGLGCNVPFEFSNSEIWGVGSSGFSLGHCPVPVIVLVGALVLDLL